MLHKCSCRLVLEYFCRRSTQSYTDCSITIVLLVFNVFSKIFHRRTQSQIVYICLFSPQCLFSNETSNRQPSGVHCQCPSAHTKLQSIDGRLVDASAPKCECFSAVLRVCSLWQKYRVHGSQTGCRALVGALQSSSASSGQSVGDQLLPRQPFPQG